VLAIHFDAHDSNRMEELGFLLILLAGVFLALGSSVPVGGRGSRSLAGIMLAVAGLLLFAAARWGTF
jgi:hypothetical protein